MTQRRWAALIPRVFGKAAVTERILCNQHPPPDRRFALVLIAYGALVISLVDNLVRPILVGADTKMPDWAAGR